MTPLELIERFRTENPEYEGVKLGYAGRLDPMAEGLMLILVGEENKKRKEYEKLDKTYEFEVLFGVKTDSYDILGIAQKNFYHGWDPDDGKRLKKFLKDLKSLREQAYPPFSSRTVDGTPLYRLARENKLGNIKIPMHKISIKSIRLTKTSHITSDKLLSEIRERIKPVRGDFRQDKILIKWQEILKPQIVFTVKRFEARVSSGTYVRGIADQMGKYMGKESLALSIKRTEVGNYTLKNVFSNKKPD